MSDYDPATTRPCLHPIEQEIPADVPKEYHGMCFICLARDGVVINGQRWQVAFDRAEAEPEPA